MEIIIALFVLIIILISLYYHLSWNYNFWQNQGIPCANGTIPILGNMTSVMFLQQNFNSICEKFYKENSKHSMFGFYQLTTPTLLIRDPELIKNILVTNFDNFPDNQFQVNSEKKDSLLAVNTFFSNVSTYWKESRAPLSNAFSRKKLKIMLGSVQDVSSCMKDYIEQKMKNDQVELELKKLFNMYSGDISAGSIGIKANYFGDSEPESDEWKYKKTLRTIYTSPFFAGGIIEVLFVNFPRLSTFLNITMSPTGAEEFTRKIVRKTLAQRKLEEKRPNDFFQDICDYVAANPGKIDTETLLSSLTLTFTAEIYERTAVVTSFMAFQLALHPEIQERVRQEIKDVFEKYNGQLEYEGFSEMTYFDQVLNESLRINRVVGTFVKICAKETKLIGSDGLSCVIKPGQVAVISTNGLHMNPEFWPEPEKFDPDRFSEEERAGKSKFTFLPFGDGPRICVGKRLTNMLVKVGIVMILKNFSLQVSPKSSVLLEKGEMRYLSDYRKGLWAILKPLKMSS